MCQNVKKIIAKEQPGTKKENTQREQNLENLFEKYQQLMEAGFPPTQITTFTEYKILEEAPKKN